MNMNPDNANRFLLRATAFVAAVGAGACAEGPDLAPAPDAAIVQYDGAAATASAADVTITAAAGAWAGDVDIGDAVTPLRITIDNDSDHKLRIRYSDFGLVTRMGDRYAAIPPYDVRGSVSEPATARDYPPVPGVGFHYRHFYVAPYYDGIYPSLSPFVSHRFYYDPYYYSFYYPYWRNTRIRVELPTPEMLRKVLPEGVLDEGGELEGFLYFQKLPDYFDAERIHFHADFVDAVTGEQVATLHIPFIANPADETY